jgi:uncharacterized protein (UPF0335 family)
MASADEIKRMISRLEQSMSMAAEAAANQKALLEEAKADGFTAGELTAMKKMASLRIKNQLRKEQVRLANLARVGEAVGVDLFSWEEEK